MNFHPVLIHFPIALLSLYTLMEVLRFKKITQEPAWFYIKAVLVIFGTVGALAAILAGSGAVQAVRDGLVLTQVSDPNAVIHMHEFLAKLGSAIFGLPAAGYAVQWLNRFNFINHLPGKALKWIWQFGTQIQKLITETPLVIVLAIAGIIIITMAAALGGSLIYGPDTDPFVKFVYSLFFQN